MMRGLRAASSTERAIAIGVLLCLVATFFALLLLGHRQQARRTELSSATFVFTNKDPNQVALAQSLRAVDGGRVLEVESKGTDHVLKALTGTTTSPLPLLVVGPAGKQEYHAGLFACATELAPIIDDSNKFELGRTALYITACLAVIAAFFGAELLVVAAFLPLPALFALAGLFGGCLSCQSKAPLFASVAPVLGLLYVTVATLLFTFRDSAPRRLSWWLAIGSLAVVLVQLGAIVLDPKLCPMCLVVSATALAYAASASHALAAPSVRRVLMPVWMRAVTLAGLSLLFARNGAALSGLISYGPAERPSIVNLVGGSLSRYVAGFAVHEGGLAIISLDGCGECAAAKKQFVSNSIAYRTIPVCTFTSERPCFDGGKTSFPLPVIVAYDRTGRIFYQRNGWVPQSDEQALLDEIRRAVQRSKSIK
jgi:hypothetical protein